MSGLMFPKTPPGQPTLREQRAQKRLARQQGAKGVTATAREKKARKVSQGERILKQLVRIRDQFCRWPGCECGEIRAQMRSTNGPVNAFEQAVLHVAHLEDKGAGGDPDLIRTRVDSMLVLCAWRHTGPWSLHSGYVRVERTTERGTDGPCDFYKQDKAGRWNYIGTTEPPAENVFEDI